MNTYDLLGENRNSHQQQLIGDNNMDNIEPMGTYEYRVSQYYKLIDDYQTDLKENGVGLDNYNHTMDDMVLNEKIVRRHESIGNEYTDRSVRNSFLSYLYLQRFGGELMVEGSDGDKHYLIDDDMGSEVIQELHWMVEEGMKH